jgi:hypothetical protein
VAAIGQNPAAARPHLRRSSLAVTISSRRTPNTTGTARSLTCSLAAATAKSEGAAPLHYPYPHRGKAAAQRLHNPDVRIKRPRAAQPRGFSKVSAAAAIDQSPAAARPHLRRSSLAVTISSRRTPNTTGTARSLTWALAAAATAKSEGAAPLHYPDGRRKRSRAAQPRPTEPGGGRRRHQTPTAAPPSSTIIAPDHDLLEQRKHDACRAQPPLIPRGGRHCQERRGCAPAQPRASTRRGDRAVLPASNHDHLAHAPSFTTIVRGG